LTGVVPSAQAGRTCPIRAWSRGLITTQGLDFAVGCAGDSSGRPSAGRAPRAACRRRNSRRWRGPGPSRPRRPPGFCAIAIDVAERAEARRLALFHHHPDATDDALDALVARARQATTVPLFGAAEGAFLAL
jgi:hypothetical protein